MHRIAGIDRKKCTIQGVQYFLVHIIRTADQSRIMEEPLPVADVDSHQDVV